MSKITIYTKPFCGYCARAVALLKEKSDEVTEISAAYDQKLREEMMQRSHGRMTYPQIFIGDIHVGGCDELFALERAGKLDPLLNGA